MNLRPPDDTARRSPVCWWSLTPPSHPYPRLNRPKPTSIEGGYFLLSTPTVTNSFYFRKWSALCRPDFPLASYDASGRTGTLLSCCKDTNFIRHNNKIPEFSLYSKTSSMPYSSTLLSSFIHGSNLAGKSKESFGL